MIQIDISPEVFEIRRKQIAARIGKVIAGNSGTIQHSGATVTFDYDGKRILRCTCTQASFPTSKGFVEAQVQNWFRS